MSRRTVWCLVATLASGTAMAQGQMNPTRNQPAQQQRQQNPQQGQQRGQQQTQQQTQQQAERPGQQQGETLNAREWVSELMLVNRWMIDLSRIAQERAVNPQVKSFAQTAIKQHQDLENQLNQLAKRANIQVDMTDAATGLNSRKKDFMHTAMLTALQGLPTLNGANVDRAYLSSLVLSHDMAIEKLQWAIGQLGNQELSQAARDSLASMSQHRERAYRLLGQVAPKVKGGQARRTPAER